MRVAQPDRRLAGTRGAKPRTPHGRVMGTDLRQIEEINILIHAVEDRIESLALDLEKLDEFSNADAYHALALQIRALQEQRQLLSKRWSALTKGYLDSG